MSVRRAELSQEEIVGRRGMPATSPLRTVADLGSRLPLIEAVVAVDMALHKRLVHADDLRAYVAAHPGRKGIARLRRVAVLAEPRAESAMETRLRLLLVRAGLPRPEAQVQLHDDRGRFLGRPDLYYPAQRLCLEYDGGTHRNSLIQDNRRQNGLLNAGFRLLRFTAADLREGPESIVSLVRAELLAGPSP
jgi:very-short-patch-repair endonuclease